jgi:pimeloyl-ACP methyl ester carboxylesterase
MSESFDAENVRHLPKAIYEIASGNSSWLEGRLASGTGAGTEALGMLYSVICREGADFTEGDLRRETPVQRAMAAGRPMEILQVCEQWPVDRLEPIRRPLVSDIPTLLMAGEFDVITPPPFLGLVAANLSRSYVFTYPGQGHGGIDLCRLSMTLEFFAGPSRAPDSRCIASTVAFTPPEAR